jgi:hypothetical protein
MAPMVSILQRWEEDGETYFFASSTTRSTEHPVIGVCKRPKHKTISGCDDYGRFRMEVEEIATEIRWFDREL